MIATGTSHSTMDTTGPWTWSELTGPTGHLYEMDENHVIPTHNSVSPEPALPVHASSPSASASTTTLPTPVTYTTTTNEPAFHSVPASTGLVPWNAGSTRYNIDGSELVTTSSTCATKLTSPILSSPTSLLSCSTCSSSLSAVEPRTSLRTYQDPLVYSSHQVDPIGTTLPTVSSVALDSNTLYLDVADYAHESGTGTDRSTTGGQCTVNIFQHDFYDSALHGSQWSSVPSIQSYPSLSVDSAGLNQEANYLKDCFIEPPTTNCSSHTTDGKHQWDIKDVKLPKVSWLVNHVSVITYSVPIVIYIIN